MKGPHATYGRPSTSQSVAYTGTAGTITNGFGSQTRIVRVVLTTAGFIAFGDAPTATTADMYMPADTPEYFSVRPGEKVSGIQSAAAGTLYVTEMTH